MKPTLTTTKRKILCLSSSEYGLVAKNATGLGLPHIVVFFRSPGEQFAVGLRFAVSDRIESKKAFTEVLKRSREGGRVGMLLQRKKKEETLSDIEN
ncbi:hypothetical protein PoB_002120800 [Plakobranchus ocellatus]|uniref:Uncharacterized protein n=1 Tax=Plakobranchus ocellatus TaxID=259542 RepID=A0AAV3ZJQ6_9GAST|nr:hypothetical protein PoB_002120800 [Plakobranchus ocellatus]